MEYIIIKYINFEAVCFLLILRLSKIKFFVGKKRTAIYYNINQIRFQVDENQCDIFNTRFYKNIAIRKYLCYNASRIKTHTIFTGWLSQGGAVIKFVED